MKTPTNNKKIRIPKGETYLSDPLTLVEKLKEMGMTDEDIRTKTEFSWDYSDCYYEGDTPSMILEWDNIY